VRLGDCWAGTNSLLTSMRRQCAAGEGSAVQPLQLHRRVLYSVAVLLALLRLSFAEDQTSKMCQQPVAVAMLV
jgi:hypothetical protein